MAAADTTLMMTAAGVKIFKGVLTTVASTLQDVRWDLFQFFGNNVYNYNVELFGRVLHREKVRVHTASEERERKRKRKERKQQERSYAVISMVCAADEFASSGSVLVALRLRTPSVEPTLEAE